MRKDRIYVASLLVAAMGALGVVSWCSRGYVGEVAEDLVPFEEEFKQECEQKTTNTLYDGSLDQIIDKRNEFLESQGVRNDCERWVCSKSYPNGYRMLITNTRSCGIK